MQKKEYSSPLLTCVVFRSDKGFAISMQSIEGNPLINRVELLFGMSGDDDNSYHETEAFTAHDTWRENEDNSFWE